MRAAAFWLIVLALHYEEKGEAVAARLQELLKLLLLAPWAFLGMWDNDIDVSDARPPRPRGDEDRWPK